MKHLLFIIFASFYHLSSQAVVDNNLAARGQLCLNDIKSCNVAGDLNDIVAITHFLYKKGKEKNAGADFKSGTFIVEDPGFTISNQLRDFVKSKYGDKLCSEVTLTSKPAYPRKSTHFNSLYLSQGKAKKGLLGGISKTDCNYVHYGIDVAANKLPMSDKKHILFGRVGTISGRDLMFIKLEEAGLSGLEVVKHGLDLISTTAKRLLPTLFKNIVSLLGLKKVTPDSLEKEFNDLLEVSSIETDNNELQTNRKERIPAEFSAYFLSLLLEAKQNNKDAAYKNAKDDVKAFGVQSMIKLLEAEMNKSSISVDIREKINNFITKLKTRYADDYGMRFGNEIVIRSADRR